MQEIIPLIEENWRKSAVAGRHEVAVRNVDTISIEKLLPDLVSADNIVFTCFTVKLCRIGELIRKTFGLEGRYIIYLHNQATILCWPIHIWGMGRELRTTDVFISTCKPDARAFQYSFDGARIETVPFTIQGLKKEYRAAPLNRKELPFVYVGRISDQKNLHTLIYAFRIFREKNPDTKWRLDIFGRDDDLGSPNMGLYASFYSAYLRKLVKLLGLQKYVRFRGYRKRELIQREIQRRRHIAVSASLHSDENFGMAPFRSLIFGNLAVLTRWGGYSDFSERFGSQVFPVEAEESAKGPYVDPLKF
ncbi:MAG: glycosyltransferase, partial [Bdellovibrionia bacterium]